jgi:hypothetical protein
MRYSNAIFCAIFAAMPVVALPIGCSHSGNAPESAAQLSIGQVGQLFHRYQKGQQPPPQELKDLLPLQRVYPAAIDSIRSKDVLVYWGAGISAEPQAASTVLAYHKDVPEKGGEVLMQDGTPKKMTAEEFRAALKPAGATTEEKASSKKK